MKLNLIQSSSETPVFAQIDLKNMVLKVKDGAATPLEVEIKIGEGNLTYSEKKTIEYTLDRGVLDEVREGDEVPVEVSFDLTWELLLGGDIKKIIKGNADGGTYKSTDADVCRPYACDIEIVYTPPCATSLAETVVLPDFRQESIDSDLRAGTLSVTGKCNVKEIPTV